MLKRKIINCGLFLIYIALVGCSGYTLIEKNENFKSEKLSSNSIIIINPTFKELIITDHLREDYFKSEKRRKQFLTILEKHSQKNDIDIEIIDCQSPELDKIDYFNDLIKLKNNLLLSNSMQDHPFNKSKIRQSSNTPILQNVFVIPPKIFPEFSSLANKYNTPYFGVCGWINIDATEKDYYSSYSSDNMDIYGEASYFYFIIVNVNTGEVIYRETKMLDFLINNNLMYPIIYDTFFMLRKNLEK